MTIETKTIIVVCFLRGLRENLLCRGELNKTLNQKPCLYTQAPVIMSANLFPQTKNPRSGPEDEESFKLYK